MTNVEEPRFEADPYPRPESVSLPKPPGASSDREVLWAEAEALVKEKLSADEYVQQRVTITGRPMGGRMIWDAVFQIDLKKDESRNS